MRQGRSFRSPVVATAPVAYYWRRRNAGCQMSGNRPALLPEKSSKERVQDLLGLLSITTHSYSSKAYENVEVTWYMLYCTMWHARYGKYPQLLHHFQREKTGSYRIRFHQNSAESTVHQADNRVNPKILLY